MISIIKIKPIANYKYNYAIITYNTLFLNVKALFLIYTYSIWPLYIKIKISNKKNKQ